MANLQESNIWESSIYQIETTDPVVGGVDGISNKQAKQLANRTSYLKSEVEALKSSSLAALANKRDISDSYSMTQTAALIATKLDSAIAEATYFKKTDKIDAYTKKESDKKFALKDDLPPLATETKEGIVKLKNSITGAQEDVAVTEKAVSEYIKAAVPPSLGVGQGWQDVTAQRGFNVTYTNTTGKPIFLMIQLKTSASGYADFFINDIFAGHCTGGTHDNDTAVSFIVPPNDTYKIGPIYGAVSIVKWLELR